VISASDWGRAQLETACEAGREAAEWPAAKALAKAECVDYSTKRHQAFIRKKHELERMNALWLPEQCGEVTEYFCSPFRRPLSEITKESSAGDVSTVTSASSITNEFSVNPTAAARKKPLAQRVISYAKVKQEGLADRVSHSTSIVLRALENSLLE
jgi:hypothetical protein